MVPVNPGETIMTTELLDIGIPAEFIALCDDWAGDTDCMLRAISSMGGLYLGSRRPRDDDGNPMSDQAWHAHLFGSLFCDIAYCRRMAEESGHEDAPALAEFEAWADETCETLYRAYRLEN